jgi:hypothetical protein
VYVTSCTCSRRAPATAPTATACHRPHPVPQEGNLPGLRQEDFKEVVRQVPGRAYRHAPSSTYADRLLWRQCCLPRIGTCLAALSSTTGCSQPPRHDAWAGLPTLAPTAALHSPADIAKLLPTPAGAALNALATDARPPWRQPPPPPPGPPLSQRPTPPRRIVHQIRGEWLERALSTKIEVNSYNANCCLNRLNYCLPCPC